MKEKTVKTTEELLQEGLPTTGQLSRELKRVRYNSGFNGMLRSTIGILVTVAAIAVLIAVLLPAIGLIYAGVLLIFDLRPPRWHPGLWLFILWLVVLVVLAVFVVMLLVNGAIG